MVLVGVEDDLSDAVARRLVAEAGFDLRQSDFIVERGAGNLRRHLPRYLAAGIRRPVLVLTDLDEAHCAPTLERDWIDDRVRPLNFMLRVAVREIEAWLLADRSGIHRFLEIPIRRISDEPDMLEDPKAQLLSLANGASAKVRKGLVRSEGDQLFRGLGYNKRLREFASRDWSSERAAIHSDSLKRAVRALAAVNRKAVQTSKTKS